MTRFLYFQENENDINMSRFIIEKEIIKLSRKLSLREMLNFLVSLPEGVYSTIRAALDVPECWLTQHSRVARL